MNLVIVSELVEPPTESLPFRELTCSAKTNGLDVLIETENELIDLYYFFLLERGMWDYCDDIILPNQESGVRLDTEFNFSHTVKTKYIRFENVLQLEKQILILRNII